jgi:hypothetical protein
MSTTLGFVYKYENRAVAVHAVIDGKPLCGTEVDMTSFETYLGQPDDITCRRCKMSVSHRGHTVEEPGAQASADTVPQTRERDTFTDLLGHLRAFHGMPDCFRAVDGVEDNIRELHAKYHQTQPPGANFGKTAPPHSAGDLTYFSSP